MKVFGNGLTLDDFLLQGFNITGQEFFAVLFGLVAASVIYEGLKTVRDLLFERFQEKRKNVLQNKSTPHPPSPYSMQLRRISFQSKNSPQTEVTNSSTLSPDNINGSEKSKNGNESHDLKISENKFSGFTELTIATLIHMMQLCLGYTLMLAVMTFNVWILMAITAGTGSGFFLFDVLKRKLNKSKDGL